MDLKNVCTALFVKDIGVSKHFYKDVLGLTVDLDFGKNVVFKSGFAIWEIQDRHVIPENLGVDRIRNGSVNRFELYFETQHLADVYSILKSKNVRFLHGIHEEAWGQQTIRFFDPDDHLIEIGESMKQFICRFYNLGLAISEITKRTGVPEEEVARLIAS